MNGEHKEYDRKGHPLTVSNHLATVEFLRDRPEHRTAILAEGIQCMLNGEIEVGRGMVKYCVDADLDYSGLADITGQPVESVTLMFGRGSNPKLQEFFEAVSCISRREGIELAVRPVRTDGADGRRRVRGRYTRSRPPRTRPLAEYRARNAQADYHSRQH